MTNKLPMCPKCFTRKILYKILGKFYCGDCINVIVHESLEGIGQGNITDKENKLLTDCINPRSESPDNGKDTGTFPVASTENEEQRKD